MPEKLEIRTLDLANRLQDMTYLEWQRVRRVIDKKFENLKKESDRKLTLSVTKEEDLAI